MEDNTDMLYLQRLRADEIEARDGSVTPRAIVEDAKDPDSPFHAEFDWDVDRAAQAHWEDVARSLIRRIKLPEIVQDEAFVAKVTVKAVPAYVHDPDVPANVQSYISLDRVRQDPDKAHRLLCAEFSRIAGLLARVYSLADALNRTDDVQPLMDRFSITRDLFEQPGATQ